MLKKRVMSLILAAMLAVGGSAFAGDVTVNGNYTAAPYANGFDIDYDVNDVVWADGGLQVVTEVTTQATGGTYAGQFGEASGYSDVDVYANNWDNGLSSGAYAEASMNGRTEGEGLAFSGLKGHAEVCVDSSFSGTVEQYQLTREINYQDGQYAVASNTSFASFSGKRTDCDGDCGWFPIAAEYDSIRTAGTIVTGQSFVTIDPTGSNRSYEATTTSDAQIGTSNAQIEKSFVYGAGNVNALVQGPNVGFAGGAASYSFTGENAGVGQAQISGSVHDGGSYSTAQSAGSSFAIAD